MDSTKPVSATIINWISDLEKLTQQSALSNSDATNEQTLATLRDMHKAVSRLRMPETVDVTADKLLATIVYLEKSYEAAVSNQWADFDSYHRLAVVNVDELLKKTN